MNGKHKYTQRMNSSRQNNTENYKWFIYLNAKPNASLFLETRILATTFSIA